MFRTRPFPFFFFLGTTFVAATPQNNQEFFEQNIRPVLVTRCYSCHTSSKMGGLRLDSREAMLEGGTSGPAIVVGKPEESQLIQLGTNPDPEKRMPRGGAGLSDEEIAKLREWIQAGAEWPGADATAAAADHGLHITPEQRAFWSFQPLLKPEAPAVQDTAWVKTPIDRFILAKLEEKG
jgi:cytochrome c553